MTHPGTATKINTLATQGRARDPYPSTHREEREEELQKPLNKHNNV